MQSMATVKLKKKRVCFAEDLEYQIVSQNNDVIPFRLYRFYISSGRMICSVCGANQRDLEAKDGVYCIHEDRYE